MKRTMKMPIIMGGMLGLMVPWMIHGDGSAGIIFIASHVVIALAVAALTFLIPTIRKKMPDLLIHRPNRQHLAPAITAFALGWAATCAFCLTIGGQHWT